MLARSEEHFSKVNYSKSCEDKIHGNVDVEEKKNGSSSGELEREARDVEIVCDFLLLLKTNNVTQEGTSRESNAKE